LSPEEARGRFAQARVARLATAGADGRPHLVPIAFAVAFAVVEPAADDVIYSVVDAKRKRTPALRRLANVSENPRVSLLADHYEEDWDRLWWVRADGRGRLLADLDEPEAAAAVALLRGRYPQQRAVGTVLAIDVERWSGWSAQG
jgi:PPOX class probable F420-dependent enzyme